MVEVGTGGVSSRFNKRNWPITEGLEAGTEKQEGTEMSLEAEEGTIVPERERKGIED